MSIPLFFDEGSYTAGVIEFQGNVDVLFVYHHPQLSYASLVGM